MHHPVQFSLGAVAYAIEKDRDILRQWMPHVLLEEGDIGSSGRGVRRKFAAPTVARLAVTRHLVELGLPVAFSFAAAHGIPGIADAPNRNDVLVVWRDNSQADRPFRRLHVPGGQHMTVDEIEADLGIHQVEITALMVVPLAGVVARALHRADRFGGGDD